MREHRSGIFGNSLGVDRKTVGRKHQGNEETFEKEMKQAGEEVRKCKAYTEMVISQMNKRRIEVEA